MTTLPLCHIPIKKWRQSSGQAVGNGEPPLIRFPRPLTAIGVAESAPLVLTASRTKKQTGEAPVPPDREAVSSARLAERLAEIEQAGGRVLVMERKRGSATWLLTVDLPRADDDDESQRKEPTWK
jgi:hypothetical protein